MVGTKPALYALVSSSSCNEAAMPVWLEVVLNLMGYAGFLALAVHSTSRAGNAGDDQNRGGET
jgi:hypothetical protein